MAWCGSCCIPPSAGVPSLQIGNRADPIFQAELPYQVEHLVKEAEENGGAGVDSQRAECGLCHATTGQRVLLQDDDLEAGLAQIVRRAEARDSRSDHHDSHEISPALAYRLGEARSCSAACMPDQCAWPTVLLIK